jgi:IstB-like ATP binding protein
MNTCSRPVKVRNTIGTHATGRLQPELTRLGRYPLIVVDEVGYIPFEPEAANLFFQLVTARYEPSLTLEPCCGCGMALSRPVRHAARCRQRAPDADGTHRRGTAATLDRRRSRRG